MSKHNQHQRRSPWRPYLQLRKCRSSNSAGKFTPSQEIDVAAQSTVPPSWPTHMQDEARHRLIKVCEWLKPRLKEAPHIRELTNELKMIRFLDVLVIFVDSSKHEIRPFVGSHFNKRIDFFKFELGQVRPNYFLAKTIVEHLQSRQMDLFITDDEQTLITSWVNATVFGLLGRNKDFHKLVKQEIPSAIGLPQDLFSIALAARIRPRGPILDLKTFNIVWRHEVHFRQIARENPQLLQLLMAYFTRFGGATMEDDPVKVMKDEMLLFGVSEAGWRYLTKHGTRLFKTVWESLWSPRKSFHEGAAYLCALQHAGLPPPPPPSIIKVWLHAYNDHVGDEISGISEGFSQCIDGRVLRIALTEAAKRRHRLSNPGFKEDFIGVCRLAERRNQFKFEKNQFKAGWSWFVKAYKYQETIQSLHNHQQNIVWHCRLGSQNINGWHVTPITNSGDLKLEALKMHNCLHDYVDRCVSGDIEIYSVRDPVTGKRKACLGFNFNDNEIYTFDAKGFANTPLSREMHKVEEILLEQLLKQNGQDSTFDALVQFARKFMPSNTST